MSSLPFFNVFLFLCCPVFDITDDVQKLNHIHIPNIIPTTSAGLGDFIHIGNPSPFLLKEVYSTPCSLFSSFSLISLSGIF